jgi:hypothetical protein
MSGKIVEVDYLDVLHLVNDLNLLGINTISIQQSAEPDIYYVKVDELTARTYNER